MKISYKKLWKLLIDRDMMKKDLAEKAGISNASIAKLGRNENVNTDILLKICVALKCDIEDILEIVPDESEWVKWTDWLKNNAIRIWKILCRRILLLNWNFEKNYGDVVTGIAWITQNYRENQISAKPWDGLDEANGGYIIVKADGEILAYHIYNRNFFEQYLLDNTILERASTSRHDYMSLYEENGEMFIKLNLQIRFR